MNEIYDEPDHDPAYLEKRMQEIYLDTFTMDRDNSFDFIADKTIGGLIESLKNDRQQYASTEEQIKELRERENVSEEEMQDIEGRLAQLQSGMRYTYNELVAVQEMKILYAVKHFEINLKDLIQTCFPDVKSKQLYRWDYTETFLQGKGIILSALNGYAVFIELRDTSNCLKHSSNIHDRKIQVIQEFKNKNGFDYKNLRLFYNRVQQAPIQFLQNVAHAINLLEKVSDNVAH